MKRKLLARRPSPAMVVAIVALVSSLTGGALAATLITGADIKNGSIGTRDIKNRGVTNKDLKNNAVRSRKVKDGSLFKKDFAPGEIPGQGPQGIQGEQGPKGDKGDPGDPGTAATRLWASVDNDATPTILYGSGVTGVAAGGFTGALIVSFDRDVSQCSFQATVLGHGGGSLNPVVTVAITTGFYAGSGMASNQVRVQTYLDNVRTERDFDVAAFC